jgi:uncharacterized protein YjbI with pentapeptide repeats
MNSFEDIEFVNVDLREANLQGTILNKCKMKQVNLSGADLSGATLSSVTFEDVDLRGANLVRMKCDNSTLQQIASAISRREINLEGATMSDDLLAKLGGK